MRAIAVLIYLAVWLAMSGLIASVFPGEAGMIATICGGAANSFLCILIHEMGHAAMAHLLGAKVGTIVAFPFELQLRPKFKFGTKAKTGKGDLGGYVAYKLDAIKARRKHVMIAAGGPLANVTLAILASLVSITMSAGGFGHAITVSIALLSLGMALANMIPFEGSDGKAIYQGIMAGVRGASRRF